MAKRSAPYPADESDRIEGFAHPRENFLLLGQDDALKRVSRAIRGGKLPGAWLICGPPGIGKATLAYRIARYLLAFGATGAGPEDLSVSEKETNARQIAARAHPGLLVLKRVVNPKTGKLTTVLPVDEIRRLSDFFGMTSGAGGWRVAIVDTADDMNDNAANALLKMLEEPPLHSILLLLSNTPGRLLPTIRSRCQHLELRPLDPGSMEAALKRFLPDVTPAERRSLARLAAGSIGAALTLATGEGAELAKQADQLIDHATQPDVIQILALGEKLARMRDGLDLFASYLLVSLSARIQARAREQVLGLDRWLALLARLEETFGRAISLHLDARQTLLTIARAIASTARGGAI